MSVAIAIRESNAKAERCATLSADIRERLTILGCRVLILGLHYEEEILMNLSNALEAIEGSPPPSLRGEK
jgi:maleate cis-trans isomerase